MLWCLFCCMTTRNQHTTIYKHSVCVYVGGGREGGTGWDNLSTRCINDLIANNDDISDNQLLNRNMRGGEEIVNRKSLLKDNIQMCE